MQKKLTKEEMEEAGTSSSVTSEDEDDDEKPNKEKPSRKAAAPKRRTPKTAKSRGQKQQPKQDEPAERDEDDDKDDEKDEQAPDKPYGAYEAASRAASNAVDQVKKALDTSMPSEGTPMMTRAKTKREEESLVLSAKAKARNVKAPHIIKRAVNAVASVGEMIKNTATDVRSVFVARPYTLTFAAMGAQTASAVVDEATYLATAAKDTIAGSPTQT